MENLKIKVNSEAESKEAQELFFELGYSNKAKFTKQDFIRFNGWICALDDGSCDYSPIGETDREITLQELRDMVVLKRNDPKDATHYDYVQYAWYVASDVKHYRMQGKSWVYQPHIEGLTLKKIENDGEVKIKEFLNPEQGYSLVKCFVGKTPIPESWIEIPDGADIYLSHNNGNHQSFYKRESKDKWCVWMGYWSCEYCDYSDTVLSEDDQKKWNRSVLWQREKESLNDKIATAEVARQEEKHSHYKKDVSHLNVIDPYRISDLYNLHPCADHIMKKSLCAGNRGHKDTLRDIQDIIDTAERWKQMIVEDNNEI